MFSLRFTNIKSKDNNDILYRKLMDDDDETTEKNCHPPVNWMKTEEEEKWIKFVHSFSYCGDHFRISLLLTHWLLARYFGANKTLQKMKRDHCFNDDHNHSTNWKHIGSQKMISIIFYYSKWSLIPNNNKVVIII